jgi:hypothetical protein
MSDSCPAASTVVPLLLHSHARTQRVGEQIHAEPCGCLEMARLLPEAAALAEAAGRWGPNDKMTIVGQGSSRLQRGLEIIRNLIKSLSALACN